MSKNQKTIKTPKFSRSAQILRSEAENEGDQTVALSFSSEATVERYFGDEVLDHGKKAVRMDWMQGGTAPLLLDHDPTRQIGVVEVASLKDKRASAVVRFSQSALAQEILADVRDGIRSNISVGYSIHRMREEDGEGDRKVMRAVDWEPLEISIVSVPADHSVGIGRGDSADDYSTIIDESESKMKNNETPSVEPARVAPVIDTAAIENDVRQKETFRIREITATGERFNHADAAAKFVNEGKSVDDFREFVLDNIKDDAPVVLRHAESPEIGLNDAEVKSFSFMRAINALANPADRRAQEAAGFEFEVSAAAADKLGRDSRGITIPIDVLKRDLSVGTDTAGGHNVSTDLMSGNFIDMLRNNTVIFDKTTKLTGLNGNLAIPRQTGGATAYWVAEAVSITESQQAFDQVTLSPETVGAFTDFSRKLMLQSSIDVEAFVRNDLARTLGLEIDRVCINGSGASNEPEGIMNTTGIGAVVGGTNGLAPAWSHIVDLESEVSNDNADVGSLFYITNTKVRGKLKQVEKASSTAQFVWANGELNGYAPLVSNQVPSNLVKGSSGSVCSAIIFGNLADLIVGMWGGLDLMVDPYTNSTSGTVRVVALQDMDLAVRHAQSFAAMQDALT